jgi:HJR/Mrr/RecB family endonuclease
MNWSYFENRTILFYYGKLWFVIHELMGDGQTKMKKGDDLMEYEPRFYHYKLFVWILLLVFPPMGIFFLWYYKHYTFVARIIISVFFFSVFRFNVLFSSAIVLILFLGITNMHDLFLRRQPKEKEIVEEIEEIKVIDQELINGLDLKEFTKLIQTLFTKMGFETRVNSDFHVKGIHLFLKSQKWEYGIQIQYDHDLYKEQVIEMVNGLDYYQLKPGIIITKYDYTCYAKDTADKLGIHLWNMKHLLDKLEQFKVTEDDWRSFEAIVL